MAVLPNSRRFSARRSNDAPSSLHAPSLSRAATAPRAPDVAAAVAEKTASKSKTYLDEMAEEDDDDEPGESVSVAAGAGGGGGAADMEEAADVGGEAAKAEKLAALVGALKPKYQHKVAERLGWRAPIVGATPTTESNIKKLRGMIAEVMSYGGDTESGRRKIVAALPDDKYVVYKMLEAALI
jgi:hypothetical protein